MYGAWCIVTCSTQYRLSFQFFLPDSCRSFTSNLARLATSRRSCSAFGLVFTPNLPSDVVYAARAVRGSVIDDVEELDEAEQRLRHVSLKTLVWCASLLCAARTEYEEVSLLA